MAGVGNERVLLLQHDAYYHDLDDMPHPEPARINYDHPDALETALCVEHLRCLKRGESIRQPVYDFSTHRRTAETRLLESRPVVLLDGMLILVSKELRNECDLTVFVDAPADIRLLRRMERDITERGRSVASVRQQYVRTVRPMHRRFIAPSRNEADIVVPSEYDNEGAVSLVIGYLLFRLGIQQAG